MNAATYEYGKSLYEAGFSFADLQRLTTYAQSTWRYHAVRDGWYQKRDRKSYFLQRISVGEIEDCVFWHERGLSQKEIGKRLGISQSMVHKRLSLAGVRRTKSEQSKLGARNRKRKTKILVDSTEMT